MIRSSAYSKPHQHELQNGNAVSNEILLALPEEERAALLPKLTLVEMTLNFHLQETGEPINFCYFPNTGMVSILALMGDGKSIEVGLAGKEGFVGMPVVAGFRTGGNRAVVQADGTAFRMGADAFALILEKCPQLSRSLTRYAQKTAFQLSQIAACNRLHEIEPRLARWLLMTQDRVGSDRLPLTHHFLSQMLGVNRSTVSTTAGCLQIAGLIEYRRGKVRILNRKGLEKVSCECYQTMRDRLQAWDEEVSTVKN
jgi:CRP-like cAMP-binding protein